MEIDDPSDWPYPALSAIDQLLRCPICTDFYKTAMIISTCSHTFCSLCIRKALQQEEACPECRKPAQENKLINCLVANQLVEKFVGARQILLEVAWRCEAESSQSLAASSIIPSRALVQAEDEMFSITNSIAQCNIPTTSKRTKNAPVRHTNSLPIQPSGLITNAAVERDSEATNIQPTAESLVNCPICTRMVTVLEVNRHLDYGCDNQPLEKPVTLSSTLDGVSGTMQPRNPSATLNSSERKRYPNILYNIYKEKDLRKILKDMGLQDHGNKRTLKERHQQYLLIYNSEQDKPNPRNEAILRQELEDWERATTEASEFTGASGTVTEQDIEDHKRKYKDHYTELIVNTEKRKKTNTENRSNQTAAPLYFVKENSSPAIFPTSTRAVQSDVAFRYLDQPAEKEDDF